MTRRPMQATMPAEIAYPRLVAALRDLLAHAETKPVLTGDGVKAVRAAGKFMRSIKTARALLRELGEME